MWSEVRSISWRKYCSNHLLKRWSSSFERHTFHSSITQMDLSRSTFAIVFRTEHCCRLSGTKTAKCVANCLDWEWYEVISLSPVTCLKSYNWKIIKPWNQALSGVSLLQRAADMSVSDWDKPVSFPGMTCSLAVQADSCIHFQDSAIRHRLWMS